MPIDPRIPLMGQPAPIQNPLETLTSLVQLQDARSQLEARRLAGEEARTKRVRQQQIDEAYRQAVGLDETTGRIKVDRAKLVAHLPGHLVPSVMKELDADEKSALDIQTSLLDLQTKGRKHLSSAAQTVRAAGYDPQLFGTQLRGALGLGVIDQETYDRLSALPPDQIQPVIDSFIAQGGDESQRGVVVAPGSQIVDPVTGRVIATGPAKEPTAADFTLSPGQVRYGAGGEQLAAVPAAPRDERLVQVVGPDGQATWVRESQAVGKRAGGSAAGEGGAVKLTAAQQEDVATMLTVQDLGKEALELGDRIKWRGVGPVAGRAGDVGARWFGAGGEDPERLRNLIGNIQGTIAKLRGGASFTPSEQTMLDRYTPTTTDSVLQIKTKLKSLGDFITAKRENTLRVAGGQYTPREPATPAARDGDRQPIPNVPGGEAEYRNGRWIRVK